MNTFLRLLVIGLTLSFTSLPSFAAEPEVKDPTEIRAEFQTATEDLLAYLAEQVARFNERAEKEVEEKKLELIREAQELKRELGNLTDDFKRSAQHTQADFEIWLNKAEDNFETRLQKFQDRLAPHLDKDLWKSRFSKGLETSRKEVNELKAQIQEVTDDVKADAENKLQASEEGLNILATDFKTLVEKADDKWKEKRPELDQKLDSIKSSLKEQKKKSKGWIRKAKEAAGKVKDEVQDAAGDAAGAAKKAGRKLRDKFK